MNPLKNQLPNCAVPKFNLQGFACETTNTLYVLDLFHGYLEYMPLDEAKASGEISSIEVAA